LSGSVLSPELLADAETAHYRLQSRLYCPRTEDLGGARYGFSPDVDDPEWNHAGLVRTAAEELPRLLQRIRRAARRHRRPPAIAVSPFTRPGDLAAGLGQLGWEPAFRHRWLFYSRPEPPPSRPPPGAAVEPVARRDQLDAFCDVFYQAFGEREELSPGYAVALRRSLRAGTGEVAVRHYLATVGGAPAAVGTAIRSRDVTGLYNLATAPAFRRRGLGEALNARRVCDALAAGARTIFLQTEDAAVARWQRRQGFRLGFEVVGLVEA
jgi:ribosomal protein S18 acetylase RimI-like enzyme